MQTLQPAGALYIVTRDVSMFDEADMVEEGVELMTEGDGRC